VSPFLVNVAKGNIPFVMRIKHNINKIHKMGEKLSSGMLMQAVITEVLYTVKKVKGACKKVTKGQGKGR
jgi:hypothetical protein